MIVKRGRYVPNISSVKLGLCAVVVCLLCWNVYRHSTARWILRDASHKTCPYESQVWCRGGCCDVSDRDRSCVYTNLYYEADPTNKTNNKFYLYRLSSSPALSDYVVMLMARTPVVHGQQERNSHNWAWYPTPEYPFLMPEVQLFASCEELSAAAREANEKQALSVLFYVNHGPWNWGHAVLDDFYPHALAQLRMGNYNDNFTFVIHANSPFNSRAEMEVYRMMERYAGNAFDHMALWKQGLYVLRNVIAGVGPHAGRTPTKDYVLAGGEIRALRLVRNRIYERYGLDIVSKDRAHEPANRTLRALFIRNKRPLGHVESHVKEVQRVLGGRVELIEFNFSHFNFSDQLRVFQNTDIYVSGVGTALVAAFLIPDHAAVLNLGDVRWRQMVSYWEEYIMGSMDYAKAFYFDPVKRREGVRSSDLVVTIGEIEAFLRQQPMFDIPLSREQNLSPLALAASDYFHVDEDAHLRMIGVLSSNSFRCFNHAWAEFVVCREGMWTNNRACGVLDSKALARVRHARGADVYCASKGYV